MQHRTWELELNHQMSWKRGPRVEPSRPFGYELGCFVLCVLLSFSSWPCLPVALSPRWALLSSTGPASSSTVSAYQWLFFVDLVLELSPSPVPLPTISWTISWTIPETDPKVTFTSIVLRKVGSVDWVCEHRVWVQSLACFSRMGLLVIIAASPARLFGYDHHCCTSAAAALSTCRTPACF